MDNSATIVIFGASGDLTERKLIPGLYNLYIKGRLPQNVNIVGNSRTEYSHDEYREKMMASAQKFVKSDQSRLDEFMQRLWYLPGNVKDEAFYTGMDDFIDGFEDGPSNRLYYLSTAPFLYEPILANLAKSGMNQSSNGWRRIVIEKPFGYDLKTAHDLNDRVHEAFHEDQVYRIDHYLGKETAQNILFFRFSNTVFEPIWNRNYIDHVQITVAEQVDVGRRAGYYDTSGVIRDMFQNHLLQLLALTAMEPPTCFDADALRNEKVKLLQAVLPVDLNNTVRAQYNGYSSLDGVEDGSITPTYAALKLFVGNWRWEGVPFYLRSGKSMPRKTSEITVQFKRPAHMMFRIENTEEIMGNQLTFRIQPNEGIELCTQAKQPDTSQKTSTVSMDFNYNEHFGDNAIPEAYERLLLDAITGDAALFSRSDGIEAQWSIVDPIIAGWENDPDAPPMASYAEGTWGPTESDDLLARASHQWIVRG
ncbi:MAG: glucose-6-phosphate dehydrogenase [Chloroflexota bacterium]